MASKRKKARGRLTLNPFKEKSEMMEIHVDDVQQVKTK